MAARKRCAACEINPVMAPGKKVCADCHAAGHTVVTRTRYYDRENATRERVEFRISSELAAHLETIANKAGCSRAEIIRAWIRYQVTRPIPKDLLREIGNSEKTT